MGFYCVDNLPSQLVEQFIEFCQNQSQRFEGVALVIDVREEDFIDEFPSLVEKLNQNEVNLKIIFLEASSETLLNRYKESRRPHPLGESMTLEEAIKTERERLVPVREQADIVFDTSRITTHQFRGMLTDLHRPDGSGKFTISLTSFGFKHGVPAHVDTLFDARFLPNPYYNSELKDLTGADEEVEDFFRDSESVQSYLDKLQDLLDLVIDQYSSEGKEMLSVGIGCTGGRHRSVYLVQQLSDYFQAKETTRSIVTHRDLTRDDSPVSQESSEDQ
jgi:UPF0042 nucleotide-binding protein